MNAEVDYSLRKYKTPADMLKAMGHPLRLCILMELDMHKANVTTILDGLHTPQSTVSMHLSILRRAGLVIGVRKGKQITYHIANENVRKITEVMIKLISEED